MHGGAPRTRRKVNAQTSAENGPEIVINTEKVINTVFDAAVSAGVSYAIASAIND